MFCRLVDRIYQGLARKRFGEVSRTMGKPGLLPGGGLVAGGNEDDRRRRTAKREVPPQVEARHPAEVNFQHQAVDESLFRVLEELFGRSVAADADSGRPQQRAKRTPDVFVIVDDRYVQRSRGSATGRWQGLDHESHPMAPENPGLLPFGMTRFLPGCRLELEFDVGHRPVVLPIHLSVETPLGDTDVEPDTVDAEANGDAFRKAVVEPDEEIGESTIIIVILD
jgi:hypothetical protein